MTIDSTEKEQPQSGKEFWNEIRTLLEEIRDEEIRPQVLHKFCEDLDENPVIFINVLIQKQMTDITLQNKLRWWLKGYISRHKTKNTSM